MAQTTRKKIEVSGTVQGVGFRPAVYRHALSYGLSGYVLNDSTGAVIEVQGLAGDIESFIEALSCRMPRLCSISKMDVTETEPVLPDEKFEIRTSAVKSEEFYSIAPDLAMCPQCSREFSDPADRRYRYPFITCGDCGPRYSYVKGTPYDRANTAMDEFPMCEKCLAEYNDPASRRFHIEGFSCPYCGPKVTGFEDGVENLKRGKVAAVKGIGGFHLVCSAIDESAVERLRKIKRRPAKGFAVMFKDTEDAAEYIEISEAEKLALESAAAPIVLVRKRLKTDLPQNIAPGNGYIGIMISYTPLHRLILEECGFPIVVTSANITGDPLIIDDMVMDENRQLYDSIITHDRKIFHRADDSVLFVMGDDAVAVRRGRGLMPSAMEIPVQNKGDIIAVGAELKSSISAVKNGRLITGNHIGDVESPGTFVHFRDSFDEIVKNYSLDPGTVVCDMHPDFETTAFAENYAAEKGSRLIKVQHHHSHFVSAYVENEAEGDVPAVVYDGTGYGADGTVWGGEFFYGNCTEIHRAGHIETFPLPGGEASVKEPWRILASFLSVQELSELFPEKERTLLSNLKTVSGNRKFSPLTSSMGRLFDAAAALAGFTGRVTYEAEAAVYLESLALEGATDLSIDFPIEHSDAMVIPQTHDFIRKLYKLKRDGMGSIELAGVFHNSVAEMTAKAAQIVCSTYGTDRIIVTGGVLQNRILLEGVKKRLASCGIRALINRKIPACDGGISAGQAIYGAINA